MSEQPPPGQPNPEPPHGQPQYPYGQQPSYGYPSGPGGYAQLPKHPRAQTSMVLGIIALAGGAMCMFPILLSPFAWYFGAKARQEMAADPLRWSGQSEAQAGFILGIIGSVLLILGIAGLLILAFLLAVFAGTGPSY